LDKVRKFNETSVLIWYQSNSNINHFILLILHSYQEYTCEHQSLFFSFFFFFQSFDTENLVYIPKENSKMS